MMGKTLINHGEHRGHGEESMHGLVQSVKFVDYCFRSSMVLYPFFSVFPVHSVVN